MFTVKNYIASLGLLFSVIQGASQNSPGLTVVVPPSPNASALGKYGEIPVGMYTGIPNINIPLYNLKGRDLEVPITLNYHAGGIRVEEIASLVGIGWSLNAGGVITRTIRGMPDDVLGGYFGSYSFVSSTAQKYLNGTSPTTGHETGAGNLADADLALAGNINAGIAESQPDIFYFNFGKYSGQFFMNDSGQFVVTPLQALKVEYSVGSANNNRLTQWILTTPDGVKYVFGTSLDGTRTAWENNDNGAPWGVSTTGWYLMEINSPNNDKITFNYSNISYTYQNRSAEVLNQIIGLGEGGVTHPLPFRDFSTITNFMTVPRLTSIVSNNGTLVFNPGADRTDLPGEKSLGSIDVYSNANLNTPLQRWSFGYDYRTNRLTLDSAVQATFDGSMGLQKYKFDYQGTLPDQTPGGTAINSQDLWGYYNGVTNSVFPQGYQIETNTYGLVAVNGADRHSDSTAMKAGTLYRITYPTGGYTQFDYEANEVYVQSGDNSIPPQPVSHEEGQVYFYNTSFSDTFTITYPPPNSGVVTATITALSMEQTCPFDNNGFSQCYYATLKGINGNSYPLTDFPNGTTTTTLLPGTYVLSGVGANLSGQTDNDYRLYMDWTEYPPSADTSTTMVNKVIGGLRIKRVTNYDGVSTNVIRYEYNKFNDTASSGVLVNEPYNYANIFEQAETQCTQTSDGEVDLVLQTFYLQVRGYPLIPLVPTQGASIGYANVTKYFGENGENGKEEYTFTTANDFPDEIQDYRPYAPNCGFDWRRGQLLRSTTYKNAGGGFVPLQTKSNSYVNGIKSSIGYGLGLECDVQEKQGDGCDIYLVLGPSDYYASGFRTVSEFQYLRSDTTIEFDQNNPSAYIQTIHNYTYDTVRGHYQIASTITTDSKGQVEETDLSYPPDLVLSGTQEIARDSLISRFILTPVLDTRTTRNSIQTRDVKTNFNVFANNLVLPQSMDQQIGSYPSQRRVEFLRYDNYGNLTEQHKANDALNTYLWDYAQSYPIASVLNADSSDIAYTSFEADGTGNWSLSGGTVDTTQAITGRNSYQNGTISASGLNPATTYIVSYWSQNGAYTIPGTISGYPMQGKTISFHTPAWTLYVHKVTGQNTITVNATGHIDELRLYPATAQMTTYTYDPLIGMTSQMDAGSRATYYEYDGLQRLKRIRDQDYNILKTIDYAYQAPAGCGSGCYSVAMQTFAGTNTLSYPVGVFDVNGNLVGNATNAAAYVTLWNGDTADARVGTLAQGADSMHFNITLNAGQTLPASVTGLRYYQVDLAWNQIDAVRQYNGAYIDFGDGTGIRMPASESDTPAIHPPNTVYIEDFDYQFLNEPYYYFVHNYPDTSLKTITCYHNDAGENAMFDNEISPAYSLIRLHNLRGYLPAHTNGLGGSCYQDASMTNLQGILNWGQSTSVVDFYVNSGDGIHSVDPISYPQDVLAGNKGLKSLETYWGAWPPYHYYGNGDPTFKISRLKSDWNTYFTQLQRLYVAERDWNREDLSHLTSLNSFALTASDADGGTEPGGPYTPLDSTEIDNVLIQIANGAGQFVSNGTIVISTGGSGRTSASQAAVNLLVGKGWIIYIDSVVPLTKQ